MRIQQNIAALNTSRLLNYNNTQASKALEKLSSGYKINRAGDDAAGLAISEKMRGQIRGLNMAAKNAQDAVSLIQTAEGALSEVHSMLQRGRELAVQSASDTNVAVDRNALQIELSQINEEIDSIRNRTEFNTRKLLQGAGTDGIDPAAKQALVDKLKGYMLESAEDLVNAGYGLSISSPEDITVEFVAQQSGGFLAWVTSGVSSVTGTAVQWSMTFDTIDVITNNMNTDELESTVAHEMTHAIMSASGMQWDDSLPKWFKEGSAEYLTGGNTRLKYDLMIQAGSSDPAVYQSDANIASLLSIVTTSDPNIIASSKFYAASYAATRYLDKFLNDNSSDMQSLMSKLTDGVSSLDDALQAETGKTINDFLTELQSPTGGINEIKSWDLTAGEGSIVNPTLTTATLIDGSVSNPTDADNFNYIWGASTGSGGSADAEAVLQIGANEGQDIKVNLPNISAAVLGIGNADISTRQGASEAITSYDVAINTVSSSRSYLGAIQNRLEHTIQNLSASAENLTAAESRIRDTDMASEMMNFTKKNILMQAAQSMLAQANQQPQGILQLLR